MTTEPDRSTPESHPSVPRSTATDGDLVGANFTSDDSSNEAPDEDPSAWEGTTPDDAVGLVDPRHEIPIPPGL